MPSRFNREDLAKLQGMTPRLMRAFEDQAQTVSDTSTATQANADATQDVADATVLTLSSNAALNNERVFTWGFGLTLDDAGPGNNATLRLLYPIKTNGGYRCTLNLLADTNVGLPTQGMLSTTIPPGPYANDAAAADGGVAIGEMYRGEFDDSSGFTHYVIAWRRS